MYNTCAASLWIRMLYGESRCISPHTANKVWKQEEKVMKHTAHIGWDPLSFTLTRVFGEDGVENIKGSMRSQWVGLLRQSKASKVVISCNIVCLHIFTFRLDALYWRELPGFKLSADPPVQTLCCVSLCCETTDRSKDCSWSWHCLSWGFFCKWCWERLCTRCPQCSSSFPLSERSFGLLLLLLYSYWLWVCVFLGFVVQVLYYILKTFVLFLKLS